MFEIDKQQFGTFVAQLRKERGLTQKEVAQRLFISDKAVSKWETAASLPDITLLIPLAELLEVSVVELLECRRSEETVSMDAPQANELVKKIIHLSESTQTRSRKRWKQAFAAAACISLLEIICLLMLQIPLADMTSHLFTPIGMAAVFGGYFCFAVKERLPTYYDENRISAYSDGPFRMNIPGVTINNSNWPHIVNTVRRWSIALLTLYPLFFLLLSRVFLSLRHPGASLIYVLLFLVSLFLPLCFVGKKYE